MQETILARLEASRKELLDLGLRNPLLNYKTPKTRGFRITQEQSSSIYDIMVRQGKAMSFIGRPGKDNKEDLFDLPELTQPELDASYIDTKLQINETEQKLQAKILNTYYFARTSIEEQGINILYISLGMLNWYEAGNTEEVRQAPLVLVPVSLERSSAQERFRLRYTGSEIGPNLSLQAKMLADFQITIPGFSETEDFNIQQYFADIEKKVAHHSTWKIEKDAIELGFFSFGKFMIYHDLDSTKWPEESKPYDHEILQSLFGQGFKENQLTATEDHNLDKETISHNLFQVVDADSSQILAILGVNEGRNIVIQGPPGTGKSQTITNIIANAVGQGKKVLFVAEKMAALEVVKRRLDNIHLGEACLELHSHKANKKELHEELRRILELGKPTLIHLKQEVVLLEEYRNELNAYCSAINTAIANSGLTAQKVVGFLLQIDSETEGLQLPKILITNIENFDDGKIKRAEAMADRIQARLRDTGVPSDLIFWGSKLKVLLPHEQNNILQLLKYAHEATITLRDTSNFVAAHMGLIAPKTIDEMNSLAAVTKLASESSDLKDLNIYEQAWLLNRLDVLELLETGKRLTELYHEYRDVFIPEAWEQNMLEIRQNIVAYGDKWYKFVKGAYNKSNKQLAALCRAKLPKDLATKLKYIDAIAEARRLEAALKELEPLAIRLFGRRWQNQRSEWEELIKAANYMAIVHQQITEGACPKELLDYLSRHEKPEIAEKNMVSINSHLQTQFSKLEEVIAAINLDEATRFPGTSLKKLPFEEQLVIFSSWIDRLPEIHHVIAWNNLADTAADENFQFLIEASTHWDNAKQHLKTALQKTWYEYLIEHSMSNLALRKFERASHEEVVEKFKTLDLLNLQYNKARVALKHWEGVPRQESGGQVSILKNEFNRKARHMPIRKLIQEAGLAIQAIKPVFMMGPMSIASFLPPGSIEFDLVIFDEASQVRPVEAIGALLRGKQLVVVGDTKQLPPTSFFDKMNSDTEDEENVTADMQSILGMCDGQGAPERMLRWHYRSRHESLISLSNHEFYENRLVIFPSPGSKQRMGLAYHYLPDAVYDRGKTRSNPKEAEAVADAVIEHAIRSPKQTLGVIAFSTAQMQAIQNVLEIKRRNHPELEGFFRSHPHEPFFVKNLENVQGDERDVIFISIGYGKTEDGKVPMSFGPLNNEGGERRLNVLITRAKFRCEVFTNITSEDIKTTETSKFGLRALKSFLYFAQHGKFNVDEETAVPVSRPFEDVIAAKLNSLRYTIRKKVGSEGFFIDLAVVDTDHPGRYLLGIDCDGEAYASAKSARDRDRLRMQVLEAIGWKMYRIWSLDWFRNPERELKRLVEAIEKAKEMTALVDIEIENYQNEINALIREQPEEVSVMIPVYECAVLSNEVATQEIHLHPLGKLCGWIEEIAKVESPVHFDEVAFRMVKAAGLSKVGSRIRETLLRACGYAEQSGLIKIKGDFLWYPQMELPVVRERSNLPSSSKRLQYISPEELCMAVKKVVESSIAIQPEAAVPFVAKLFGFSRVTEEMRKDLLKVIELSVEKGMVVREGELLKSYK